MVGPKSKLVGLSTSLGGKLVTVTTAARTRVLVPTGPLTVRVTVLVPGPAYTCISVVPAMLVVAPSPKSQNRLPIVPMEVSVKLTVSGQKPRVGLALKSATGTTAPLPATRLVELPPLLEKIRSSLKLPSA